MRQTNTREQVLVLREAAGKVVGMVAVPTPLADQDKQGAYRLVPWDSIAAETHVCPFDNS